MVWRCSKRALRLRWANSKVRSETWKSKFWIWRLTATQKSMERKWKRSLIRSWTFYKTTKETLSKWLRNMQRWQATLEEACPLSIITLTFLIFKAWQIFRCSKIPRDYKAMIYRIPRKAKKIRMPLKIPHILTRIQLIITTILKRKNRHGRLFRVCWIDNSSMMLS